MAISSSAQHSSRSNFSSVPNRNQRAKVERPPDARRDRPNYVERRLHGELVHSKHLRSLKCQRDFVRVVLQREKLPANHRRALPQCSLGPHQALDVAVYSFELPILPISLVHLLSRSIDGKNHEIKPGSYIASASKRAIAKRSIVRFEIIPGNLHQRGVFGFVIGSP